MVLRQRYWWGYRTLVAEVSDSIHLRRFGRISLCERVPDESTVRMLTRRFGLAVCSVAREQRDVVHDLSGGEAARVGHGDLAGRGDAKHDGGVAFGLLVLVGRDGDTPRLPNRQ